MSLTAYIRYCAPIKELKRHAQRFGEIESIDWATVTVNIPLGEERIIVVREPGGRFIAWNKEGLMAHARRPKSAVRAWLSQHEPNLYKQGFKWVEHDTVKEA